MAKIDTRLFMTWLENPIQGSTPPHSPLPPRSMVYIALKAFLLLNFLRAVHSVQIWHHRIQLSGKFLGLIWSLLVLRSSFQQNCFGYVGNSYGHNVTSCVDIYIQKVITKLDKLLKCWMPKFYVILQANKINAWKVAKVGNFGAVAISVLELDNKISTAASHTINSSDSKI